jgi:hypothetical protein
LVYFESKNKANVRSLVSFKVKTGKTAAIERVFTLKETKRQPFNVFSF